MAAKRTGSEIVAAIAMAVLVVFGGLHRPVDAAAAAAASSPANAAPTLADASKATGESTAASETPSAVETEFGGDRFAAGPTLRLETPSRGDLIAAGGRIELGAPVAGDTVLVGGQLRLSAATGANVYAGGGRVQIAAAVGRNLRAAGGQVEITPSAQLAGNASLAGGEVTLRGPVKGSVQIAAAHVLIDAAIGGDVRITAEEIELGPAARIGGALRWRSPSELVRHASAQVAGAVERLPMPVARERGRAHERPGREGRDRDWDHDSARGVGRTAGWLFVAAWTLGLMLVAAVAIAALPAATRRVAAEALGRPGWSLLVGFVTLVCVPVAVVLLFVSLVGAPLGLIALLLYPVVLVLGYVGAAAALGQWGLGRWKAAVAGEVKWRIGAALAALLVLALIGRVPFVGGALLFLLGVAGLGAIVRQFLPPSAAAPASPATPAGPATSAAPPTPMPAPAMPPGS